MSLKIALCGFYGKKNFGDDLMQDCLADILSQNGVNHVTVYSDDKNEKILNGLIDKSYLDADLIVIGGGGIIDKNFWVFKDNGISYLIGKKVWFLNVNVYKNILQEKDFSLQLKNLNASWWVRDSESDRILSKLGISSEIMPDVAFYKTTFISHKNVDSKKLVFFPNHYAFYDSFVKQNVYEWINTQKIFLVIANYFDWLISFGWEITISFAQHGDIDDRIIGAMILAHVKKKQKVKWDTNPVSWEEKIDLIKSFDLVLSMRYHTTLLAVMNEIPCIDLMHHDKNKFFWQDLGYKNTYINMYKADTEDFIKATNFYTNLLDYVNKKNDYCTKSKKKWEEFEQLLSEESK